MTGSVVTVDDESFDAQVLSADLPTLVLFTAAWSAPAKKMEGILQDLAPSYDSRLSIFRVDIDSSPQLASKYGIQNVPELRFFKQGQQTGKRVGALEQGALKAWIDSLLK